MARAMETRICRVTLEVATGKVTGVITQGETEVATINWFLAGLYGKDPELALDMIRSRFREWARLYHTTDVEVITL